MNFSLMYLLFLGSIIVTKVSVFDKSYYAVFEYSPFHHVILKYEFDITDSDCIEHKPKINEIHWFRVYHMCTNSTF